MEEFKFWDDPIDVLENIIPKWSSGTNVLLKSLGNILVNLCIYVWLFKRDNRAISSNLESKYAFENAYLLASYYWYLIYKSRQQFYSFNLPLIGTPSVEWCSKDVFPQEGGSRAYIKILGKIVVILLVLFQNLQ
jgi:hypothetical protein